MDFTDTRYYKLCRNLLIVLGLWPDNNPVLKRIQQTFYLLLFSFSIILQFTKITLFISDLESLLSILSFAVPCLLFFSKYTTFCIKSRDIQELMELLKCNWIVTKCKKEIEILHHYASIGYLLNITMAGMFYSFYLMFLLTQMLPKLLDIVAPLNESRSCKLMGVTALYFDENEHFFGIFMHMAVALFLEITTLLTTETICLTYMQHCCALFKITSFRIENIVDYQLGVPILIKETVLHANITKAIIAHNKAIKYFEFLNSTFGMSYFIMLVLGVSSLSINMFHLFQASYTGEIKEAYATALLVFCHFFFMFIINAIAQNVTNVSLDIFYATCNLPWYIFPVRLQKIVGFIMRRSMTGDKFVLGVFFEGSLECFTSIVSTSMSYFTVFWSMRH